MEATATATPHSLFVSINKRNNLQVSSIEASHDLRIKKIRRSVLVNKSISMIKRRKNGATVIKRSRVVVRSKRTDEIERRVQKLKKLIPINGSDESTTGLDGLFRDTADYILALQMRVRCMQMMVNALTTPGSN